MPIKDIDPELLNAKQAAKYLGVSKTYFERDIRPYIASVDLKRPDAKKPMPRWSRTDLDAFVAARRRERKAS